MPAAAELSCYSSSSSSKSWRVTYCAQRCASNLYESRCSVSLVLSVSLRVRRSCVPMQLLMQSSN